MAGGGWGPMAGRSASATSQDSGLPFAGIPSELGEKVQEILDNEPEHETIDIKFSQIVTDARPLNLRRFLAPHWVAMSFAFLLVIFEIAAQQAGPLLTKIGIDRGIMSKNTDVLVVVALSYIGAVAVNSLAGYGRIAWTGRVGEKLMMELRIRVFSHFQRLSMDLFTEEKAGRLMTRMTSDIEALTVLFHEGLINLVVQALAMIFVTVVLVSLNLKLTLFTLLIVVPLMFGLTVWFRYHSERGYSIVRDRIADVLSDFQETLTGIRIIAAFNRQLHNRIRHRNIVGLHRDANQYTARLGAFYSSSTDFISITAQALVLLVGGKMLLAGNLTLGELTAFVLYLSSFFAPIQQLVQLYNTYQQGQAAMTKLRDLLGTKASVPEDPDAGELPPIEGGVHFKNLTFSYEPGTVVLKNIDLEIKPGETFALVGETGAGKSTLAKLVIRFYDPDSGQVLIDGHDLRGVTLKSLRKQIGYVPQEPFLFAGTIFDNINFSRPESTKEEVQEALKAVGIDDLIEAMPQGLDTICHERGASLSSGERQLLALARAFNAKPRVIVLDEATSNLDLASESRIEKALDALLQGRTAIIIAHRLTTAARADRIGVVEAGEIVEIGSHDELVAKGGRYSKMYATWMKHTNG